MFIADPKDSPKLRPYPSWEWHMFKGQQPPEIVSPFRIRADSCDRLWVLDSGYTNIMEGKVGSKPQLLIFDLNTDKVIKNYTIPEDQYVTGRNLFCSVVVEENNCNDSFAYLSDLSHPAMVVYSFENDRSWVVQHNFFALDPLAGEMTVAGVSILIYYFLLVLFITTSFWGFLRPGLSLRRFDRISFIIFRSFTST